MELTPEGDIGRQDYKNHAHRGTYTLHSLYLLLWANFGCFCMALLTQQDSDKQIHGNVISKQLALRSYCMSQLKSLWEHLRSNLGLSEEQRAFFVSKALSRFNQVCVPSGILNSCAIILLLIYSSAQSPLSEVSSIPVQI